MVVAYYVLPEICIERFRFCILEHPPHRLGIKMHRSVGKVRNIERTKTVLIMPRVLLRKDERLGKLSVRPYVAEIRPAVFAVSPLAGKDEPASGRRPAVIGVGTV